LHVSSLLFCTYHKIADKDLENLRLQASPTREQSLQNADQDVAERRADKSTVCGHLGYPRGEVVAVLVAVFGDPGCEEFLKRGQ